MEGRAADELLCACLSEGADEVMMGVLAQWSAADWESFTQLATRRGMGVAPLLYSRLKALSPDTVPPGIVQELKRRYLDNVSRNVRLFHELGKVLAAFREEEIPVIALKGAHLAEVVYGNIGLRPMSDVDLLVKEADLSRVERLMLEIGYAPSGEEERRRSHLPPFAKVGAAKVDVHWTITLPTNPFEIDVAGLWERARSARIGGVQVKVLSPEDLLLHLCLHLSHQHGFGGGLRALCDVADTLRYYRDEIDWGQAMRRAWRWRAHKCLYLALLLAKRLLRATVPEEVLHSLEPRDLDPRFVTWAEELTFPDRHRERAENRNLARAWGIRRIRDAVTLLRRAFPPPGDLQKLYPLSPYAGRAYLYYPLRLKYLVRQYGSSFWRSLRHGKEISPSIERQRKTDALMDWLTRPDSGHLALKSRAHIPQAAKRGFDGRRS